MISVIVASFGSDEWLQLAMTVAGPSAGAQTPDVLVRHDLDGPIEDVRNKAAREVAGPWLCFLDADDTLAPGFVDAMGRAIKQHRTKKALFAPYVQFDDAEPVIPSAGHPMPPLNHCVVGTVVHREVFDAAGGFRSEFWPWSDYELWLRCARHGARVEYVPDAVYRVRVNPGSDNQTLTVREGALLGRRIEAEHRAAGGEFPIKGGEAQEWRRSRSRTRSSLRR